MMPSSWIPSKIKSIVLGIISVLCLLILLYIMVKLSFNLVNRKKKSKKDAKINLSLNNANKKENSHFLKEEEQYEISSTSKYQRSKTQ